jgi:hypothetical protein
LSSYLLTNRSWKCAKAGNSPNEHNLKTFIYFIDIGFINVSGSRCLKSSKLNWGGTRDVLPSTERDKLNAVSYPAKIRRIFS